MGLEHVTDTLLLSIVAILLAYDIAVALLEESRGSTISRRMLSFAKKVSTVPYAWGAVAGHWWAPFDLGVPQGLGLGLLLASGAAVGVIHRRWGQHTDRSLLLAYMALGVVCGVALWPLPY